MTHLRGLVLVLAVLAGPAVAGAQPADTVVRIEYLSLQGADGDRSWVAAFRQGLGELGYVEGRNLAIEQRHAAGRAERLPELASELVQLKLDVLVVYGLWALSAAGWKPPGALPVVFTVDPDPVGRGLVATLARPGGNVTGLSDAHADLVPKRLELLKEVAPSALRVAVLFNPASVLGPQQLYRRCRGAVRHHGPSGRSTSETASRPGTVSWYLWRCRSDTIPPVDIPAAGCGYDFRHDEEVSGDRTQARLRGARRDRRGGDGDHPRA